MYLKLGQKAAGGAHTGGACRLIHTAGPLPAPVMALVEESRLRLPYPGCACRDNRGQQHACHACPTQHQGVPLTANVP